MSNEINKKVWEQMDQELTPKEIVEKDFNLSMRGYNPTEVDEYLDIIIRDYDRFITEINELRDRVQELEEQLDGKQETVQVVEEVSDAPAVPVSEDAAQVTNFDILKRLSNLERHVFGSKLNNQ